MKAPLLYLLSPLYYCAVHAYIEVISTDEIYPDRTADFGPGFPIAGMSGYLIPVEFLKEDDQWGCQPIDTEQLKASPTFQMVSNPTGGLDGQWPLPWIALVERGKCSFIEKVRAMQASGASAVIVGDNQKGTLLKMYAAGNTTDVQIPSAFVMQYEYRDLKYQAMERIVTGLHVRKLNIFNAYDILGHDRDEGPEGGKDGIPALAIRIFPDEFTDWPILDLLSVVLLGPAIILLGLYSLWRCRDVEDDDDLFIRRNPRDAPAPQYMVNNLPRKTFCEGEMGENDHDMCAICLDNFEDGEGLRVLPCKHDFHVDCIDQWLLTRKRTCPICKADACPPNAGPPPVTVPILPGSDGSVPWRPSSTSWFPWVTPNPPTDNPPQPPPHHHDPSSEAAPFLRVGGVMNVDNTFFAPNNDGGADSSYSNI